MTSTRFALEGLAEALKGDLEHAERHAAELQTWTVNAPTGFEVHAAAMLLHHLYGAIEAMVERSLKIFDGVVPTADDSHVQLLEQAATEVSGARPAILPHDDVIDELRRFRHRFRHRYDVVLDPTLLHVVIKSAVDSWPRVRGYLAGSSGSSTNARNLLRERVEPTPTSPGKSSASPPPRSGRSYRRQPALNTDYFGAFTGDGRRSRSGPPPR